MGKVIAAGVFLVNKKMKFWFVIRQTIQWILSIPKGKVEVGETMINANWNTYEDQY
jgi:hypothetical protein